MVVPEIGNRNISGWWIWRNLGLDCALDILAMSREYPPLTEDDTARGLELADYFDEKCKEIDR